MTGSPTLEDVARLSRTSRATVSRVINGQPGVHIATEQRVRDAIHRLNYRPNRTAQALATGQSALIALILPRRIFFSGDRFGLMAIELVYTVVNRAKYAVQLCIWDNELDCQTLETFLGEFPLYDGAVLITRSNVCTDNEVHFERLEYAPIPCAKIEHQTAQHHATGDEILHALEQLLHQISANRREAGLRNQGSS